jgi:hypothetical protein
MAEPCSTPFICVRSARLLPFCKSNLQGDTMIQSSAVSHEATIEDWKAAAEPEGGENLLLQSLPADEARMLESLLESVELESGVEISGPGESIDWVYFPDSCVLSLITVMSGGGGIESLTTGRDGLSGFALLTGCNTSFPRVVCQVPGRARRRRTAGGSR